MSETKIDIAPLMIELLEIRSSLDALTKVLLTEDQKVDFEKLKKENVKVFLQAISKRNPGLISDELLDRLW